jgi:SPX domain protein involved in polyphosphate accumulation
MSFKISPHGQWSVQEAAPATVESFAKGYVERHNEALVKSTEASLFKRFEDKYILPRTLKDALEKALSKHLKPDYPDSKTRYNLMKSTYFDSKNLDMVKHHTSKAASRFKIRTRDYAPNGKLHKSDFTYLEVKAKHGDVCDKFRIKVPKASMQSFEKGLPIIPNIDLIKANPHIGVVDLVKRVADINGAMQTFDLRPSCEVSYTRRAFSDGAKDDGLRVTFDEGVKYNVLDIVSTSAGESLSKDNDSDGLAKMVAGYSPADHIILEVKHHGSTPDWLNQFLNDHKIVKTQFSKYCYSMAKHAKGK